MYKKILFSLMFACATMTSLPAFFMRSSMRAYQTLRMKPMRMQADALQRFSRTPRLPYIKKETFITDRPYSALPRICARVNHVAPYAREALVAGVAGYCVARRIIEPHAIYAAEQPMTEMLQQAVEDPRVTAISTIIWDNLSNADLVQKMLDEVPHELEDAMTVKIATMLIDYKRDYPTVLYLTMKWYSNVVNVLTQFLVKHPAALVEQFPDIYELVTYLLDQKNDEAKTMLMSAICEHQELIQKSTYGKEILYIPHVAQHLAIMQQ